jgi:putative ABC transport system permease protein
VAILPGPFANFAGSYVLTRATAQRIGVRSQATQALFYARAPRDLTDSERQALERLQGSDLGADLSTRDREVQVSLQFPQRATRSDVQFVTYAIILPAALVLALLTTLVGLALTASETRDEEATFVAIGAGPGHRRRQRAWQALIVSALGALLAIPGGLIPAAIILKASSTNPQVPMDVAPPWLVLVALGVALPLLAAAVAALSTRSRIGGLTRRPA